MDWPLCSAQEEACRFVDGSVRANSSQRSIYQAYTEQAQQANGAGQPPMSVEEFLIGYNDMRRTVHQNGFPLSDNLFALIFTVLADLTEQQRERMQSATSLQGQRVQDYTFAGVLEVFIELFCAPRSSLENPNLRGFSGGRSFCVIDQGEMDGSTGYWVEDDGNGEVGFLMEFEDTCWVFDETSYVWMARKFAGRRFRKGQPKGKGKGKGVKGKSRFIPFKPRYKGGKKGQAHQTDAAWAGKGGKPKNGGKPKGGKPKGRAKPDGKGHANATMDDAVPPPAFAEPSTPALPPASGSATYTLTDTSQGQWQDENWWEGESSDSVWWTESSFFVRDVSEGPRYNSYL